MVGAAGYVGSAVVARLRAEGEAVVGVGRGEPVPADPGHVLWCAGLTTDAAQRPLDTLQADVADLVALLRRGGFASLLFLSSTRVYAGAPRGDEDAQLRVRPTDLFAAAKLAGEAACLSTGHPGVRVIRLATVYGGSFASPNFLCALLRDMAAHHTLTLAADPHTARDYVHVEDVAAALPSVARAAPRRLYNLASGEAVANDRLVAALQPRLCCTVRLDGSRPAPPVPPIATARLRDDLGLAPRPLLPNLDAVVAELERAR